MKKYYLMAYKTANSVFLYWNTIRYLKPVQIYGRLWFRLYRPNLNLAPSPQIRQINGQWQRPAPRQPSVISQMNFLFHGQEGSLLDLGWDGPERGKLWRYNQHYFDDLNAKGAASRIRWHKNILESWVSLNSPGEGSGWEPYPTSLRIVNWVKWALSGNELSAESAHSLAIQTRWLIKRLEWHLLGNHLFANAKALVFAGLFFEGDEADQWVKKGLKILKRQLDEQFLSDGGQFELSPMYHAIALEDILDLINVAKVYHGSKSEMLKSRLMDWETLIPAMQQWMSTMCHPDGELSFFNDAAFNIAPSPSEIEAYANRLGFAKVESSDGITLLSNSGYTRLQNSDANALLDMARVGPDYLPGHAHADTLSFELSLFGQRILVNSGTSCYGTSAERLRQRGTAAHNTVVVNKQDSSEVWSGFRVARRAKPIKPVAEATDYLSANCAHDGYQRLPGNPTHERFWELHEKCLTIMDRVHGSFEIAEARFHFHPDIQLSSEDHANKGKGFLPNGKSFQWEVVRGIAYIERTSWHPQFGSSVPNSCLVIDLEQGQSQLQVSWT